MTLLLFVMLILLFCLNVPIAVAVGLSAVIAFVIDGNMNMILITQRLYAGADSFPLMAVPLFMIAGQLMGAGGISKRIVNFADTLVGHLSGGLAAVSVVSAMFFSGISGSAAADTAAVGAILIPSMVRRGYTPAFSGAVQAAAGSIGVIIPPSIPMIIFGVLTGASIGRLFAAGILPGILMGLSLIGVCVWNAKRTETADTTTKRAFSLAHAVKAFTSAIWALGAPFIIIGGILGGVFTATESAAVAVVYALFVGMFIHKELSIKDLPNLFISASITSSVVMFIICAASIFSWYMAIQDIPASIASSILSLTDNRIILLLLINLLLLIAGTILETTAALILFVPVLVPMLPTLGIDPVQLGAIVVVNLAIGMLTPPLGVCTIVACSIAHTRIGTLAKAIVPFLVVLLLDLLLITFWAPLTTYLPNLFFK
jgi:tripartite ATP-independent transporter DctM subunit